MSESASVSHNRVMITARDLVKEYPQGESGVRALDGVSLEILAGSFVAITGPSGAGKSTLLHLLGGLDVPTSGDVFVDGERISDGSDAELSRLRRQKIGFIFQFFNLLPTLSAWENVALPLLLDGWAMSTSRDAAVEQLDRVGLAHRYDHRPSQLSGGEMQRVAVARSLINDPKVLLADEPTGNLDSETSSAVLDLLRSLVADDRRTVVMVTHEHEAAEYADRTIRVGDGRVLTDEFRQER